MFPKSPQFRLNALTILGVFAAVAAAGLLYAMLAVLTGSYRIVSPDANAPGDTISEPPPVAPTVDEYQASAAEVLAPFLQQAAAMTDADFDGDTSAMRQMVTLTQERLLRLRVPKEQQSSHLQAVLLLDQWKRALEGSAPDRASVLGKTADFATANPWARS